LYGSTILEVTFKKLRLSKVTNISTAFHHYFESDTFPLLTHLGLVYL